MKQRKWAVPKGSFGYIKYKKKESIVRTVLFFALSLAIYGLGIYSTGSNKNLLTIVAVLGCLPACKSAVNAIMFLRATGCSEEAHERISAYDGKLTGFYDMYFTSYQQSFPISHMVLKGNTLCAYTENPKCNVAEGTKHLGQMFVQDGYKNICVKIFTNLDKYIDRLGQLHNSEVEEHREKEDMIRMLYSISLS
ncbi:MAG: hypothetical protein K2P65_09525 [Lachnospiraceae bacterium]|nr:hypothetical protein [Lachnospiraceae bacterium]